jgi:UDP-glucose 4-epimerase
MRALVTGGAGFIGSHVVDALTARGDEVVALDDLSNGRRENLASSAAELAVVDVRDDGAVRALFEEVRPELVFHLAARTQVRRSIETPAHDARVNVEGTINVLEAARRTGVRRLVNASTGGAIYGDADTLPAREDTPARPKAPYGQSKLAAEGYCELYRRLHGLSTVTLRFGNVYGPRQDPFGEAGVVGIFCASFLRGDAPRVFGDGLQTRDYAYVGDVTAANLAAADADAGGAFNVGRGVETSVLDLVSILGDLTGATAQPDHAPARPGEVRRSALDASRARAELGWAAEVDVRDGLERTLAFVRERMLAEA